MKVCKGILQVFDDVSLALDRVWTVLSASVHGRLLPQNGGGQYVVDCGYVLDLLLEAADALELTGGRGERVLVLGHGVGRARIRFQRW